MIDIALTPPKYNTSYIKIFKYLIGTLMSKTKSMENKFVFNYYLNRYLFSKPIILLYLIFYILHVDNGIEYLISVIVVRVIAKKK